MLGPSWLQVGSSWPMLAPRWLPVKNHTQDDMPYPPSWPQVGSILAPCWLHVGSMLALCWLMLGQVASKMAPYGSKLAQVGLKMPLCWLKLASRYPIWLSIAKLHQLLIQNCSFWNALHLQNVEKTICFICL